MASGDQADPVPELDLRCIAVKGGLALEGTLRGQACYFAEVSPSSGKTRASFMMSSVAGIELRGRIEAQDVASE